MPGFIEPDGRPDHNQARVDAAIHTPVGSDLTEKIQSVSEGAAAPEQNGNVPSSGLPEGASCGVGCGECTFCGESMSFKGNVFELDDTVPDAMQAYIKGNGFGMKVKTWNHEKLGDEARFDFQRGIKHFTGTLRSNGEIELTVTDVTAATELAQVRESLAALQDHPPSSKLIPQTEVVHPTVLQIAQTHESNPVLQSASDSVREYRNTDHAASLIRHEPVHAVVDQTPNDFRTQTVRMQVDGIPAGRDLIPRDGGAELTDMHTVTNRAGLYASAENIPVFYPNREIPSEDALVPNHIQETIPAALLSNVERERDFVQSREDRDGQSGVSITRMESQPQLLSETDNPDDWDVIPVRIKSDTANLPTVLPADVDPATEKTEKTTDQQPLPYDIPYSERTIDAEQPFVPSWVGTKMPLQGIIGEDTEDLGLSERMITDDTVQRFDTSGSVQTHPEQPAEGSNRSEMQVHLNQVVETHLKARESLWQFVGDVVEAMETSPQDQFFMEPVPITAELAGEHISVANESRVTRVHLTFEDSDKNILISRAPENHSDGERNGLSSRRIEMTLVPEADAVIAQYLNKGGFVPVTQEQSGNELQVMVFMRREQDKTFHIIVDRRADQTRLVGSEIAFRFLRQSLQEALTEKVQVWCFDTSIDQTDYENDALQAWSDAMSYLWYFGWLLYVVVVQNIEQNTVTENVCSCGGSCHNRRIHTAVSV